MLADLIRLAIVIGFAWLIGYAGYISGRDAAERRCFRTISDLRHELRAARIETARLRQRVDRLPYPRFPTVIGGDQPSTPVPRARAPYPCRRER